MIYHLGSNSISGLFIKIDDCQHISGGVTMLFPGPPQIFHLEYFTADHPFVYYIWDRKAKTSIFSGRITKFPWIESHQGASLPLNESTTNLRRIYLEEPFIHKEESSNFQQIYNFEKYPNNIATDIAINTRFVLTQSNKLNNIENKIHFKM